MSQVKAMMIIRKPASEVYQAFVDPAVTTKFWFTKSSGRLEPGAKVTWEWEMYGASAPVEVQALEPNARIRVLWGPPEAQTSIEWTFQDLGARGTFVTIENDGLTGTPAEVVAKVNDAAGGFNLLLAGAKAWLEHGLQLNLVGDHVPT